MSLASFCELFDCWKCFTPNTHVGVSACRWRSNRSPCLSSPRCPSPRCHPASPEHLSAGLPLHVSLVSNWCDTVTSFNFMSMEFRGLTTTDMCMDPWIHGFPIIRNITDFGGILNLWIALPTKNTIKFPRIWQRIKMISQMFPLLVSCTCI